MGILCMVEGGFALFWNCVEEQGSHSKMEYILLLIASHKMPCVFFPSLL